MSREDAPPQKRRKLKPPGTSAPPTDDPSRHDGRVRAVPHVEGQWSTHVYLDIAVQRTLREHVEKLILEAGRLLPSDTAVHSLVDSGTLHLSLSRPLQLWTNQRDAFKAAIVAAVSKHPPLTLAFAGLANLTNDEKTRQFLCLEVGYGHEELLSLVQSIDGVLASKKLPVYYEQPRFHASIAWWLPREGVEMQQLETLDISALRDVQVEVGRVQVKIGKDVVEMGLLGKQRNMRIVL